jgi:hypothetical protein
MKNRVLMNKRINAGQIILLIVITSTGIISINNYITKKGPVINFLCIMLVLGVAIFFLVSEIIKLAILPRCKAVEFINDDLVIYGYKSNSYIRRKLNVHDIKDYQIKAIGWVFFSETAPDYYSMKINTNQIAISINGAAGRKNFNSNINYPVIRIKRLLDKELNRKTKIRYF